MGKRPTHQEVLAFWFSLEDSDETDDAQVERHHGVSWRRAMQGDLEAWSNSPRSRLALIQLFDQVPRYLFRHDSRAFATDYRVCKLTQLYLLNKDCCALSAEQWAYGIRPFLHAEDLHLQLIARPILQALSTKFASLPFMGDVSELYIETIDRSGRFPHRNALRGFSCSDEEQVFLDSVWHPRRQGLVPPSKASVVRKPVTISGSVYSRGELARTNP